MSASNLISEFNRVLNLKAKIFNLELQISVRQQKIQKLMCIKPSIKKPVKTLRSKTPLIWKAKLCLQS